MFKFIMQSDMDCALMKKYEYKDSINKKPSPSYRDVVVKKPWGHEFLAYETDEIAVWILYINKEGRTSFHSHAKKMTSLLVVSGSITFHTCSTNIHLLVGDGIEVGEGVFHQSVAEWGEDVVLIEIESPPYKLDLVRAKDCYGRENMGYEGSDQMTNNDMGKYHYFYVNEYEKYYHVVGTRFLLVVHHVVDIEMFKKFLHEKENSFFRISNNSRAQENNGLLCNRIFVAQDLLNLFELNTSSSGLDILEIQLEGGNGIQR